MTAERWSTEKAPRTSKRIAFLASYVKCGNVTLAAREARVSRQQHYAWLKDAKYSAAFAKAHKEMEKLYLGELGRANDPKQKGNVGTPATAETWAAAKAPRGSNRAAFLAAYAQGDSITLTARRAQVSRQQHYEWLKDPKYSRAFAKAQRKLFDRQMAEMEQRIEKARRGY